jgi:hypothetical protein
MPLHNQKYRLHGGWRCRCVLDIIIETHIVHNAKLKRKKAQKAEKAEGQNGSDTKLIQFGLKMLSPYL